MKHEIKFLKLQAELKTLHGSDPVLDHLLTRGPVTRQSYLEYAYPDGVPDPMQAELEGEIPRPLQLATASPTHGMSAPAPVRTDFESQDDFEEAMSRWRWTVGRNKAITALTFKGSQPK
ncbi:hypothetical protein QN397_23700 [Variovorax sp. RTB1]|uniref:hypothetical protein n=1 Tax=Variovorax sp. RTB1 TaxID=3048631 RepID=UPI002B222CB0|nr:hypothetical protein [Variovorax sp. RTB1]MEB0114288.1 hypothetical protein [Variovorax sp. RTB1]